MNPLERALARRRTLGARLSVVALVLLVGSSGIVVPSVGTQRRARGLLETELLAYEDTLRVVTDLRAFERDGVHLLEDARSQLATYAPATPSRGALRAMLLDRTTRSGIADPSIEISPTEPIVSADETVEAPPGLCSTAVVISGSADFDSVVRLVHLLSNPRPLIVVREASLEREESSSEESAFGQVKFSLRLGLVQTAAADADSTQPTSQEQSLDGGDAAEDHR